MVETRSSRARKTEPAQAATEQHVDAVTEVKAVSRRSGSARSTVKAAAPDPSAAAWPVQQQQERAEAAEEVVVVEETFKVSSVVEVTPKRGSAASTPARATTAPRTGAATTGHADPGDEQPPLPDGGDAGPRVNRRLSMRELVQQVQDMPLPDEDAGADAPPPSTGRGRSSPAKPAVSPRQRQSPAAKGTAKRPATATKKRSSSSSITTERAVGAVALLALVGAATSGVAFTALCTPAGRQWVSGTAGVQVPAWAQRAVEPHCVRADALLVQPALSRALLTWRRARQQAEGAAGRTQAWAASQYQAAQAAVTTKTTQVTSFLAAHGQQAAAWLEAQRDAALATPAGKQASKLLQRALSALRAPRVLSPLSEVLPPSDLASVVVQRPHSSDEAPGAGWVDAEDVLLHAQQGGVRGKATGLLLACSAGPRDDCADALQRLVGAVRLPQHLLALGDDSDAGAQDNHKEEGAAGRLQKRLAQFLDASPTGVVLVAARGLAARSWGVLSNALSEGGSLQLDGRAVGTARALFVVLVPLAPPPPPPHSADAAAEWFESQSKAALQRLVAETAGGEAAQAVARALRRRFEFVQVTPGVVDAAAEAANELAAAQAAAAAAAAEAEAQRLAEERLAAAEEAPESAV